MTLQDIASASAMIKQELSPLAEKIGQGAEFTYGLFVKQVYVNAFGGMLWTIVGIILFVFSKKMWKYSEGLGSNYSSQDERFGSLVVALLCLVAGLAFVLIPTYGLIATTLNPDYQAIELIIQTVKSTTR